MPPKGYEKVIETCPFSEIVNVQDSSDEVLVEGLPCSNEITWR